MKYIVLLVTFYSSVAFAQQASLTANEVSALMIRFENLIDKDSMPAYVLNTHSYQVMGEGMEDARIEFVNGIIQSLDQLRHAEVKRFAIELLQHAGKHETIPVLESLIADPEVSSRAIMALAQLQTAEAAMVLLRALEEANDEQSMVIIPALGYMKYQPAQQQLVALATKSSDPLISRLAWAALAQAGDKKAAKPLFRAANKVKWQADETAVVDANITFAYRMLEIGQPRPARRIARKIANAQRNQDQVHYRVASLDIMTRVQGKKHVQSLIKATRDPEPKIRATAINLLGPMLEDSDIPALLKGLDQQSDEIRGAVLAFLVEQNELQVLPYLYNAMNESSPTLQQVAVLGLASLEGSQGISAVLAQTSTFSDDTRHALYQALMLYGQEDFTSLMMRALVAKQDDPQWLPVLLDVVRERSVDEAVDFVFEIIETSSNENIIDRAYHALPAIAHPDDLERLFTLLSVTEESHRTFVQQAIVFSVRTAAPEQQKPEEYLALLEHVPQPHVDINLPILSGLGGVQMLEVLTPLLNEPASPLNQPALTALVHWQDESALPEIRKWLRKELRDDQKDLLIRGLVRLVTEAIIPDEQKVLYLREAFENTEEVAHHRLILHALQRMNTYTALVFAGSFLDDAALKSTAANTTMNIALENPDFYGAEVREMLRKVHDILSGSESSYLREAILKHLSELPEDDGFVSIFNGDNLHGWKGLVANPIRRASMDPETLAEAQMLADRLMAEGWYAADGVLHFNGHGDNIATAKSYGDIEMIVDWKLAADGEEGDAGIYLRGSPQVQIWDISRVNVGAQVGSGGLYNNQKHESNPLLVADNPLGDWNTFRIRMVGDKVTVYLNGHLVTDEVVLENYWDRSKPISPREQIELQAHGTHVSYRNIYVREL